MAAPSMRLIDSDPERTYFCPGCRREVPLAGYRLLYRDTKRCLRCRQCEASAATPDMRRYYAREFERYQRQKRTYVRTHPEIGRQSRAKYDAAHGEERREYKAAWYALERDRFLPLYRQRYAEHREEMLAKNKEYYHGTVAPARRVAYRRAVREAVAAAFGVEPDRLLDPRCVVDSYLVHARKLAIYRSAVPNGRHSSLHLTETAAEYHSREDYVAGLVDELQRLLLRYREGRKCDERGEWYSDVLHGVQEALNKRNKRSIT